MACSRCPFLWTLVRTMAQDCGKQISHGLRGMCTHSSIWNCMCASTWLGCTCAVCPGCKVTGLRLLSWSQARVALPLGSCCLSKVQSQCGSLASPNLIDIAVPVGHVPHPMESWAVMEATSVRQYYLTQSYIALTSVLESWLGLHP